MVLKQKMYFSFLSLFILLINISSVYAEKISLEGTYKSIDQGYILKVVKISDNEPIYKISSTENDYKWETIGFFSENCNCVKGVFRYLTHKDTYGDYNGFHKFTLKDNGNKLIKEGGWEGTKEFKEMDYIRIQ